MGFALLTIRNGNQKMPEKYPKTYAEKLLMLYEGQTAPMHYHWNKMEDIINRGGNNIYITVYNGAEDGSMLDTDVTVHLDGKTDIVPAGTKVCLKPGESITITPYMYHDFIVLYLIGHSPPVPKGHVLRDALWVYFAIYYIVEQVPAALVIFL